MNAKGFSKLEPDTKCRVERSGRVLGNVGHFRPTKFPELARLEIEKALAVEAYLARGYVQAPTGVAQQGESNGRLARTGLTDETEQLSGLHGERDVSYNLCSRRSELNPEVLDLEPDRGRRRESRSRRCRSRRS